MKRTVISTGALTLLLILPTIGSSTTINYNVTGTPWATNGISSVGTYGDTMAGMEISVLFDNGMTESATWTTKGSKSGFAAGTGWSLAIDNGSTYINSTHFSPWIFAVDAETTIAQITIDAGIGNTVFDAVKTYASDPVNYPNTAGSESGSPFSYYNSLDLFDTAALYSGPVALIGEAPVGDIYRYLTLDFGIGINDATVQFSADTDTLTGELSPVPEPSTMLLLGSGILGVTGAMRRKRKKVLPVQ